MATAIAPAPNAAPLDDYLSEVVRTLKDAVNQGTRHLQDDDPSATDHAIKDCEEMLDVIMEGNVKEWVGE